jgi:hypothetical protein
MSEYFVAGGTYTNLEGEKCFDLVCPSPGEPPYVLIDGVMDYFSLIWQNAHLYRVEEDQTLVLVAMSFEAVHLGIEAPEIIRPDENLWERLRAVIKHI